jgi:hypothetical protein
MLRTLRLLLFALASAALLVPSAALANDSEREGAPSSQPVTLSFEVVGVSPDTRVAKVVLECAGGWSGKGVAVKVGDGVDMAAFTIGAHLAGKLDKSTNPPTVVALQETTCGEERPKPECPGATTRNDGADDRCEKPECPGTTRRTDGGGDRCPKPECPVATTRNDGGARCEKPRCPDPAPKPTSDDARAANNDRCRGDDRGDERPKFRPSFLNRVWRFEGSADFFEAGVLGMTVETVKGLPRRLRDQDDELLDQDALVLVGTKTKVYDKDGKRTTADALADADRVSVRGKLLPPAKWRDDEDGQATPTLRAKRVYVLG